MTAALRAVCLLSTLPAAWVGSIPASAAPVSVSVMTYNVHGLPWPLARGRDEAFERIEQRLTGLREKGSQPHIVVLQEAFTDAAKAIGSRSGYRYVVNGPSRDLAGPRIATDRDRQFHDAGSFLHGETQGKLLDSGLQILSDYPILSVRRIAFPAFACAGFDCLANKGVMLVTIAVPGSPLPIQVATTHMNSKRASGVSTTRSYYAYKRQADAIVKFLSIYRNPHLPIIFAGDFNASSDQRKAYLTAFGTSSLSAGGGRVSSALHNCLRATQPCGTNVPSIAQYIQRRSRDWQFYAAGLHGAIEAVKVEVPFGREKSGSMLSDHAGYDIVYRLTQTVPFAASGA